MSSVDQLYYRVKTLNDGLYNILIEKSIISSLSSSKIKNFEELESRFNGNIQIVVSNSPAIKVIGPMTIPGADRITDWYSTMHILSSPFIGFFNAIRGMKVSIDKVGDTFNISSSNKVIVYVPPWFLSDTIVSKDSVNSSMSFTDEMRIGIILHEIGHWASMNYILLALVSGITGILLFFKGLNYKKNNKNIVESINTDTSESKDNLQLKAFSFAISGIILYFVVNKLFRSLAESNADSYAVKFGYGPATAKFLELHSNTVADKSADLITIQNLFIELIARIKSGYPSINWRVQDLLRFSESDTNLNTTSFSLINVLETTSEKLLSIVSKLTPFNKLVKYNISSINTINENINLLINESIEK
jgi:hypothetical protein